VPLGETPVAERISAFLREIVIPVEVARVAPEEGFLPGIRVDRGRLLVDEARLSYPGDLLHEAGHIAMAPPELRPSLTGAIDVPGLDMAELEVAAVAWSYAAALAIGIDPAEVFHPAGYRGRSAGLLMTFASGVYPGAHLLEAAGLTATGPRAQALGVAPYPHMLRWLR
jgi:hypothetical protein